MSDGIKITKSFIFVDRRKSGRGKSLPNRQRLLARIKSSIKAAKPEDIDAQGVRGAGSSNGKQLANPVVIAKDALAEPTFRYANDGEIEVVLPGNDRWLKGDEFPLDGGEEEEGEGEGNGPGEDGEDDFIVNISRSEFYDVFFEDCELPDMEQTAEKENPEAINKPAGFQKEGNPGQLSVIRSYKNALPRRRALASEAKEELERLEEEIKQYEDGTHPQCAELTPGEIESIIVKEMARCIELRAKINNVPFFEKLDLRYAKKEKIMVKSADATLIIAMDVSGSMDETRKRLARKFFALQCAFIMRKYPNTDVVFITHTDHAEEVTEEDFFTTRKNGGTVISPAIALAHQIVKDRYDATQTNIYFSYAGDGDNWDMDNRSVIEEFESKGFLSKLRHAVYAQVGSEMGNNWTGSTGQSRFWNTMSSISKTTKKLHLTKVVTDDDVFKAFKSVYAKKPGAVR